MQDKIPSSLQSLISLGDISSASKAQANEDYFQLKRDYNNLLSAVTSLINAVNDGEYSPTIGNGSPEGVVSANYSLLYVDSSGATLYYNPTYGADTGWTVVT